MENDMEITIIELITHAGEARSLAIQAVRVARKGEFEEADKFMQQCAEAMVEAHNYQTSLISAETNGDSVPLSLLMVHAQDHVMNAMTVKDMAAEMIEILREFNKRN